MKILITGAAGFLGRSLVRQLGAHELFCISRSVDPSTSSADNVHWIEMNLSEGLDTDALPEKLDAIIHLAQSNGYRNFPKEAPDVFAVNVNLVQELCDYGVASGISSMVLASTGTVYEPFTSDMFEDAALRPTGYYGASKLAAELLSEGYSGQFNVANLRVFFLYGPGQENMLIARLIENVKAGNKLTLPKDGNGLVFVPTFVEDTARIFVQATEEAWQGAYNVASPHTVNFRELLEAIGSATGKKLDIEITDGAIPTAIIPSLDKLRTKTNVDSFLDVPTGITLSV